MLGLKSVIWLTILIITLKFGQLICTIGRLMRKWSVTLTVFPHHKNSCEVWMDRFLRESWTKPGLSKLLEMKGVDYNIF